MIFLALHGNLSKSCTFPLFFAHDVLYSSCRTVNLRLSLILIWERTIRRLLLIRYMYLTLLHEPLIITCGKSYWILFYVSDLKYMYSFFHTMFCAIDLTSLNFGSVCLYDKLWLISEKHNSHMSHNSINSKWWETLNFYFSYLFTYFKHKKQ